MAGPMTRGALIGVDPFNPFASVIIFQYNPETLTRTLTPRSGARAGGSPAEAMRLEGPPQETIRLKIELDATEQLERGDPLGRALGLHPQLAALEMLLYPKSAVVIANTVMSAIGTIEIIAPEAPLTLFVWGIKRVVPVRLNTLSIAEQVHDGRLNPIHATADIDLRVLSYADLKLSNPGYYVFLAHQVLKETMATMGSLVGLGQVAAGNVRLV